MAKERMNYKTAKTWCVEYSRHRPDRETMIKALNVFKICAKIFISIDFLQHLERKVNKYAYIDAKVNL